MCLLSIVYRIIPECPLLFWVNRDELLSRPSAPPRIVHCQNDRMAWLGGIDLKAGGTWLGINEHGLVVAVTNRPKSVVSSEPKSRGLLCRDLLGFARPQAALDEAQAQLRETEFDGCNVAVLSREFSALIEASDDVKVVDLPAGIHAVTNGNLNDNNDVRIRRVRTELEKTNGVDSLNDWIDAGSKVCCLHGNEDDAAICLHGEDPQGQAWGTVSSTIIALTHKASQSVYRYAPKPPCEAPYDDYSPLIRRLLNR